MYGRRTIHIIGTSIGLLATIAVAISADLLGYLTARFFQGFGVSPVLTVAIGTVGDMFFDYERGHKFGLWMMARNGGFLVTSLCGSILVDLVGPNWDSWVSTIAAESPFNCSLWRERKIGEKHELRRRDQLEEKQELLVSQPSSYPRLETPKNAGPHRPLYTHVQVAIGVVICFPFAYKSDSAVSQSLLSLDLLVETVISNLLWSGRLSGCLGREVGEEEQECSSGGDEDVDDVSSSTRGRCRAIALGCQN
ncbi:hypothetical protein DIZ76_012493 [Coccidioides immitis]|nr:hypothetical protein DIZ76_012493 [Coccidioides immitis]